jgi:parvulin-like peptidyl-prolyl isomerase
VIVAPPSAVPAASAADPAPTTSAVVPPREIAGAAHILVAYSGAELAAKTVTRSKDTAQKRAAEALVKITKDKMPFEEAAKKYSDDPGSKALGGAIGNFERNAMPEAFSKATFAMKVGDISEIVETPRGFHIIKRTK